MRKGEGEKPFSTVRNAISESLDFILEIAS
jgi:hypothetical protein